MRFTRVDIKRHALNVMLFMVLINVCHSEAKAICNKYKNLPKSEWHSLRKECQMYLKYHHKSGVKTDTSSPTFVPPVISTSNTGEHSNVLPANFGEREFEKEVEIEGRGRNRKIDIEIEKEIDAPYYAGGCSGSSCSTEASGPRGRNKDDSSAGGASNLELLRTVAVLGMAAIAGITIIVLAIALFCLVKKRGQRQTNEERKDSTSGNETTVRGHQGHHRREKSPPVTKPHYNDNQSVTTYKEAKPTNDSLYRPPMARPPINEPEYSLVSELPPYSSVVDERSSKSSAPSSAAKHYYYKLDQEGSQYLDSSFSNRGSYLSVQLPVTPQTTPTRGSPSASRLTNSSLSLNTGQYDHLDHSPTHSRTPSDAAANSGTYMALKRT